MFRSIAPFRPPGPKTLLWRHVRLSQLLAVLETNSLWFSAVSELEDKFEGSYTLRDLRRQQQLALRTSHKRGVPPEVVDDFASRTARRVRAGVFLNCWYSGIDESAALWQWASRQADFVAIQTTYGQLQSAIASSVYAAKVRYIDYERQRIPPGSVLNPYFCKRRIFQHENEVRMLLYRPPAVTSPPVGIAVGANGKRFIRQVMLAPYSPRWVRDTVASVVRRYGLKCPVVPSGVDAEPPAP
jgi:hypothetical protein